MPTARRSGPSTPSSGCARGPSSSACSRRSSPTIPRCCGPAGRRSRPRPERRRATATILFAELAGSARMRAELGDEDADAVRREHDRRLRDVLAAHGGRAVKALGDGFLAVFDSAGAAIACAVEMQRAIDRQARRGPVALELRVGVGAGDVAWEGDDVFGTPVSRRSASAPPRRPGRSSSPTPCACSPGREPRCARGRRRAGAAGHRASGARVVRSAGPRRTRRRPVPRARVDGATVFAGREAPVAGLRAAWSDAVRGRRRGVFVSGEPGIGKTRLAAEIAAHAREREGGVVLYGRCDDGLAARAAVRPGAGGLRRRLPGRRAARPARRARGDLLPLLPELARACPASPSRRPPSPRSSGCARWRPPPRCWRPPAPRRPCCSCSTTCTGPTTCRCCSCATCCAPTPGCGCSWSPPTATPSPAARRCSPRS